MRRRGLGDAAGCLSLDDVTRQLFHVRNSDQALENSNIANTTWSHVERGVGVVEYDTGAGELAIHNLTGAVIKCRPVPAIDPAGAFWLGVGVNQTGRGRELGDYARCTYLRIGPHVLTRAISLNINPRKARDCGLTPVTDLTLKFPKLFSTISESPTEMSEFSVELAPC